MLGLLWGSGSVAGRDRQQWAGGLAPADPPAAWPEQLSLATEGSPESSRADGRVGE